MIQFEQLLKNTKVYKTIISDKNNGILSHCLMIVSEDEIACKNLCKLIARALLCKNNNCGYCKDCTEVENYVHPCLITLESLTADGIREFISKCYLEVEGDVKVALIENFHDIDKKEQNKLLKLLEEPGKDTIFVLGVTKSSAVLDTIKSRATKMYIEAFDKSELIQALKEEVVNGSIEEAVSFSEGSLTNAINILSNDKFIEYYNVIIDILINMENSRVMLDSFAKLNVKEKDRNQNKENAMLYLNVLEIIVKQTLEYLTNQKKDMNEKIEKISKKYNVATLVNIEECIINSRKKIELFCDVDGVMSALLMSILEVRYKCQ